MGKTRIGPLASSSGSFRYIAAAGRDHCICNIGEARCGDAGRGPAGDSHRFVMLRLGARMVRYVG